MNVNDSNINCGKINDDNINCGNVNDDNVNCDNVNDSNVNCKNINCKYINKWYSVGTTHGSNPHTLTEITSPGQHEVKSYDDGFRL